VHKAFVAISHKTGLGNCGELMYSALYHAMQYNQLFPQSTLVEPYAISNGDHCVLLIGREPGSDCNLASTWGTKVIVADPLLGQIYPFNELTQRLITFQTADKDNCHYNLILSFNSIYHVLTIPFLARPQANFININMTGNDFAFYFVNDLMRKEKKHAHIGRILLFYEVIIPRLRQALAEGLVTEKQVKGLKQPALTLKTIFGREKNFEKLRDRLLTLQEVDLEESKEAEKKCSAKTPLLEQGIFAAEKKAEAAPVDQESKRSQKRSCAII
jgi:hypothetical protein